MTNVSSVSPNSTPERPDGDESASTVEAAEHQTASGTLSQSQPSVRRSSLRPAPADYRPSARDPATLRPMAVVRAGDAEPSLLHRDIANATPSRPPQTSLDRSAKEEPFALAEDYSASATDDRTTPLLIPPPPLVPIDLIQRTHANRQPPKDFIALAHPVDPERETPPRKAAAVATTDSSRDLVFRSANASSPNLHQHATSASTGVHGPATSKRQKYSLVAVAIASMVLVGAVLTVLHVSNRTAANPTVHVQAQVEPARQQPAFLEPSDAPAVSREPSRNAPSTEPASAAESAAMSPAASAPLDKTRVTLELAPIDAKVLYRGREVPGPPFVFDVANGDRMAVEVLRFGFVTAKVVIDDKKPVVHFGMLRDNRVRMH